MSYPHHNVQQQPASIPPPEYPNPQPVSIQPPFHQSPAPVPPGYQTGPYPPHDSHQVTQVPPAYTLRTGFIGLPTRFHIWNVMTDGTSCLELGPQFKGPVAYSAKMFSVSRLKIKKGPYFSGTPSVCTIESRHMLSSRTTIRFEEGFEVPLKEQSEFQEGAAWPFDVEVNGHPQTWLWTKIRSESRLKAIIGAISTHKLGSWELVPMSNKDDVVATFSATGGNTFEEDAPLGFFEFHGLAATGNLGDIFANVAIAVLLRIISQHFIGGIAAAV